MDWNEAISLLHGANWKHTKIGLERMREVMHALGDPQDRLRYVHIAGTNGKGSACAMTQSILTAAGFRTGLYISPHLDQFNERISIDGEMISDGDLRRLATRVRHAAEALGEEPTDFEMITALAFCYFEEQHCDFVVLEVGMGGRLDATNVIAPPEVAAIMHIGLDHTEFLGDTVEKVAAEKAGILKAGSDCVLYHQLPSVMAVVERRFAEVNMVDTSAAEVCMVDRTSSRARTGSGNTRDAEVCMGQTEPGRDAEEARMSDENSCSYAARLIPTDPTAFTARTRSIDGQVFDYRGRHALRIRLLGNYQMENAMVVLDLMDCLIRRGFQISEEAIRAGLAEARWPGRFELLSRNPLLIVDGAHNPNGVEALVETIRSYFPDQKINFVMGVMRDKDYHTMLRLIAPYAARFITELPDTKRALDPEALKAEIRTYFDGPVETAESVTAAVQRAMEIAEQTGTITLCFGSLYQVADIRRCFLR